MTKLLDYAKTVESEIRKSIGIPESRYCNYCFIEDGQWVQEWEEGGGSHSWFEKASIRDVTELESEIFSAYEKLYELLRQLDNELEQKKKEKETQEMIVKLQSCGYEVNKK